MHGMVVSDVGDELAGTVIPTRITGAGILGSDLAAALPGCSSSTPAGCPEAAFASDVFTLEATAKLLLPRAVGYSTGLLDHFFRAVVVDGEPGLRLEANDINVPFDAVDPPAGGFLKIINNSGLDLAGC